MGIFDWLRRSKRPLDDWKPVARHEYISAWQRVIDDGKSWIVFENGTCVVLSNPADNLINQAIEMMRQYGPAHPGAQSGDFGIVALSDDRGWVVTGQHSDILTYVSPDEIPGKTASDFLIGVYGRGKRDRDATDLTIIYQHDRRQGSATNP